MKKKLTALLAMLLAVSFVFTLAACGGDEGETTTAATTEAATDVDNTTATDETTGTDVSETGTDVSETGTDVSETGTDVSTTLKPGETTTKSTTTKPVTVTAPVNGSMSQVLTFYNQYANEMKSYKGKVTITKKSGTVSKITKLATDNLPFGLGDKIRNKAEEMLPNDYEQKPTYTFTNGKSNKDNKNLSNWLPRDYSSKMSELSPTGTNGVKSATCVKSGSGWKVTIMMLDDHTSGANALKDKPKYVSKCMDTLDLGPEKLDPFTLLEADVNYSECKIEAVFDSQGRMTKLDVTTPAKISGNLKGYGVTLKDTRVTGTYKGNYTFTY